MRAILVVAAAVLGMGTALVAAPVAERVLATKRSAGRAGDMTELQVRDVIPLEAVHQAAIILTAIQGELIVPVLVSEDEGEQVEGQLHGAPGSAVLRKAIAGLGGKLVRVELPALRGDSVVAVVVIDKHGKSVRIESNPADSIGLAVAEHAPVLASKAVMDGLGLTRDQIRALLQGHDREGPGSAGEHTLQPGQKSISL